MSTETNESHGPKRRASSSPIDPCSPLDPAGLGLANNETGEAKVKQERSDSSSGQDDGLSPPHPAKRSRTAMTDAESNTMHSGKFPFILLCFINNYRYILIVVILSSVIDFHFNL